jgi:hypothetical protein
MLARGEVTSEEAEIFSAREFQERCDQPLSLDRCDIDLSSLRAAGGKHG